MRRKNKLPELLSPAGDFESLVAAVAAGADAVYVGGKSFGARAFAKNFDTVELSRALSYCHLHSVKLYVTVNTLIYDREMEDLCEYVKELWKIGVDAIICADLGAVREIRRVVPDFEIHASTQMSLHSIEGVNAAARLGCTRAVLARELSIDDIRRITENSAAETEVFLHGALCVCHSGQCLFSSLVGGRSGNRGECAQPCRLPYGKSYPLSLKDLSLAEHIRELIDSGVASLKIEGRMKSPEYVYTVTKIYRTLLDEGRCATSEELQSLKKVFSRGGFTDAYFRGGSLDAMTGIRSERDKQDSRNLAEHSFTPERVAVRAKVKMQMGIPSELKLTLGERSVVALGAVPQAAKSVPLRPEDVKARLCKMGNTDFSLRPEDIELSLDEGINLSPSAINSLRREACDKLADFSRVLLRIEDKEPKQSKAKLKPLATALFYEPTVYDALRGRISAVFDMIFVPIYRLSECKSIVEAVALPPVIFDTEQGEIEKMLENAVLRGVKSALVANIGQIELVKRFGLLPIGDYRLNISNSAAREQYRELGVRTAVLSPELTLPMARDIGGGVIVYGKIPLMLTERCFIKENFGCDKCGRAALTDRTGVKFQLMREYPHRNLILNSTPTYMGDRAEQLRASGLVHSHLIFTTESESEVAEILSAFEKGAPLSRSVRRMGKRE